MIAIIGAGLGGLALAQGLKKANIPFRVYERDKDASYRAQGYRIRISVDSLRRLLPDDLWDVFEATSVDVGHGGSRFDALTGQPMELQAGPPPHAPGGSMPYNVDRATLRRLLLCGLEDKVVFGKRVEDYQIQEGRILLHFADGSSERTDVLVGADGTHSSVRRQRMPQFALLDTEGRAIYGKTPISPGFFDRIPSEYAQGLVLAGPANEGRIKLFSDAMHFKRPWGTEAAASANLQLPEDYLYWILLFRQDVIQDPDVLHRLHTYSPEEAARLSLDLTALWHPRLRTIFEEQDIKAASSLTFLSSDAKGLISSYKSTETAVDRNSIVTLIGDAAHAFPPVGGTGATSALQDAAELCDALCKGANDPALRAEEVSNYEHAMRQRAVVAVERSLAGAGKFFEMKPIDELKPVIS